MAYLLRLTVSLQEHSAPYVMGDRECFMTLYAIDKEGWSK